MIMTDNPWPKIAFADREDSTVNVTLTFLRSELLYDISNRCYLEGDTLDTTRYNEHVQHQIMDINNKGNIDRVNRTLMLSFAECVELLFPYTKMPVSETKVGKLNDMMRVDAIYVMDLCIPDDFSKTSLNYLVNLIHEYLVCRVIIDWFRIVCPELAEKYRLRLEEVEDGIRETKARRTKRIRRAITPF